MTKIALLLTSLLIIACSPYAGQIKQLEADYRAGKVPPQTYYAARAQMEEANQRWQANYNAQMLQYSAAQNQANAQMSANLMNAQINQNSVNAYNTRSMMSVLPSPPQYIYGNVNHNVNGTIYLR